MISQLFICSTAPRFTVGLADHKISDNTVSISNYCSNRIRNRIQNPHRNSARGAMKALSVGVLSVLVYFGIIGMSWLWVIVVQLFGSQYCMGVYGVGLCV